MVRIGLIRPLLAAKLAAGSYLYEEPAMNNQSTAAEVLDREFLELRAGLLQIAAQLDRLDRAAGQVQGDARLQSVRSALAVLSGNESQRAEKVQLIFSRQYDSAWKQNLQLSAG